MNVTLHDVVTPAGIIALGLLIRQVIEVGKGLAPLRWIDAGNERKTAILLGLAVYVAWFLAYQTDPGRDVFVALSAWVAVSLSSIGANEAIDAGQQTVARIVLKQAPAAIALAPAPPELLVDQALDDQGTPIIDAGDEVEVGADQPAAEAPPPAV